MNLVVGLSHKDKKPNPQTKLKLGKPLLSSPDPVQTLNDSTDDSVLAQLVDEHVATLKPDEVMMAMPDKDAATVEAENRGLDDVLIIDGMEIDEFDQELEAMKVTKLVNMAEEPVHKIDKLHPVTPVLNGITAMPQYHKLEARAQLEELKEIREAKQDIGPFPPEKRARFSKMVVKSSSMTNLTDIQQENLERDHHSSPSPADDWLDEFQPMERSVKKPPSLIPYQIPNCQSYQTRKQSLNAAAESVKRIAASLSSNDEEGHLGQFSPNESRPSEPFNFEDYDPKHDCSSGLWLKTLGVLPFDRPNGMHKKIASNHTRLKRFQQV